MLQKLLVWLGLGGIFLAVAIYASVYFQSQSGDQVLILANIDEAQDIRTTGYPDSRKISLDSQGNIFVAYRKSYRMVETTQQHIFVSHSTDGGKSWRVLNDNKPVENVGDYNQRVPSILVDDQNVIHVVWYGNDAQNDGENERQIKYVRSIDGGVTWSDWRNLAEVTGYEDDDLWQEHPTIYAFGETLYVVWQGRDAEYRNSQSRFVRSADGGITWSYWANISPDPTTNFSRPALAITSDGVLYALAYSNVAGWQQLVWSRSRDDGVTWTAWDTVAADEIDQRHFSLAVDEMDNLHVVWREGAASGENGSRIVYAVYDGRSWTPAEPIAPLSSVYQFFPSAAFDDKGNLFVAWMETAVPSGFPSEKPENGNVFYAVKSAAGWSASQQFTSSGQALYPSLAATRQGMSAVWLERSGDSGGTIRYGILLLPEPVQK